MLGSEAAKNCLRQQIVVVRHAPVLEKGLCYGRLDLLSEDAESECLELASTLAELIADGSNVKLMSSPATRCSKVARKVAQVLGYQEEVCELLAELNMGSWEGEAYLDLAERTDFRQWMQDWQRASPPGGESLADLEKRVKRWLKLVRDENLVVAFSHAGFIRALRVLLGNMTWLQAMGSEVEHLKPYVFRIQD